jgi:hypothetical protein
MVDYYAVAHWPEPAYTCRQFSSYDRSSVDPNKESWFANSDFSQFLRSEVHDGRKEWVMMDADGPGCVVRFWHAGSVNGIIRIYLDDSNKPVLQGRVEELLGGQGIIASPFSKCVLPENCGCGKNLYLPIPYAGRCVVTYDGPNYWENKANEVPFYWQINYRTYEPDTKVETFSMQRYMAAQATLDKVAKTLLNPPIQSIDRMTSYNRIIRPGSNTWEPLAPGPALLKTLEITIGADDYEKALRATVIQLMFDEQPTVWCPLGDFFGSGVGLNPFQDWYRTVKEDGTMVCRWIMPYKTAGKITLYNFSEKEISVKLKAVFEKYNWDDRSMYFHATWHYQWPFESFPRFDWNFIKVKGKGIMVGDTLALMSGHSIWWGEGDEKIYVDDESFPSHFGTGTEDYYGYAYGAPIVFSEPFHAQPRVDLYAHMGHRTNTRSRSLDAVPFEKSLRFDIESWGCFPGIKMAYAGTTYWYGRPGATCNYGPPDPNSLTEIPSPYPGLAGVLEAEKMIRLQYTGAKTEMKSRPNAGFSADEFWSAEVKAGDKLKLQFELTKKGEYDIKVNFAKTPNSATTQIYFDDKKVGEPMDLYAAETSATGPMLLGQVNNGVHQLEFKFIGATKEAKQPYVFGMDYIKAERSVTRN